MKPERVSRTGDRPASVLGSWSSVPGRSSSVELHIDELLLHGFTPADRQRIGAALAGELERLLAEQGVPEALGRAEAIESLDAGAFAVGRGVRPEAIGRRVALAVYERLCR